MPRSSARRCGDGGETLPGLYIRRGCGMPHRCHACFRIWPLLEGGKTGGQLKRARIRRKERTLPTPARPVSVAQSTGPMSPARERQRTYGRPVCPRRPPGKLVGSAGMPACRTPSGPWNRFHSGRSPPPSLIPGAHQVPARAMGRIMREAEWGLVDSCELFLSSSRINGLADGMAGFYPRPDGAPYTVQQQVALSASETHSSPSRHGASPLILPARGR